VPEVPAVPGTPDLAASVAAAFANGGPLARALPAFEARPGQRLMADAVARVFAQGGALLAEAGTGTGKTLAYLVPAVLSRQRVLVSTGTKNLQEQVFYKDLPVLRDALGVSFRATYMKGRGNYLCLHRFDEWCHRPGPRPADERAHLRLIADWAGSTETGDRAEIEDLPEDLPFWNDIAATSENCLGADCPRHGDCFITRMRQRAAESDLVIVNHHLLCADASVRQSAYGEVIPSCHYAILDEAHQLEDVATQYFGLMVSNYRLIDLVRDGERVANAGLVGEADHADGVREDLARLLERSQAFFAELRAARLPGVEDAEVTASERKSRMTSRVLQQVAGEGQAVLEALDGLQATVGQVADAPEDVLAIGRRAAELRQELKVLLRADDPDYVFYLETRGRGVFLRASPIDVSRIVRELVIDRFQGTVLTSATLAVGDSFTYVRDRLGLDHAGEIRLPSEFDYRRQAILYLPPQMPDPRSPRFAEAVAREAVEILRRSRGRAFVLFTSYATLREVERRLVDELPFPILVQGSAPRSALLRDFRNTPHAVLLATSSFWQGVDVVGDALSCVVIDKLPFASPADPITAARIEAIASRGGAPFTDYQVPLAILALLQGLGRLLRHRGDRGVLAVLDPRLKTMPYGARFLASLPPAPVVGDVEEIARFFAEGVEP
jgi:ATP-dependent DNA helicase DinG